MFKQLTIVIVLLFHTTLSFSQEENWDVYMAQYEKGPGSTVLDMGLKSVAPIKKFPFLLRTGVKTSRCDNTGLPEKKEFEVLYKISDRMKLVVDSVSQNKFAGTFTYQCERMDLYYVSDTTKLRRLLENAYQSDFPGYTFTIAIKEDKAWDTYLNFLYPNEETLEYMGNQKVVMNLADQGDDLSKPRKVEHWLYFKTQADRDNFITYALKQKFKVESKSYEKDMPLKYQLQLSRTDHVDLPSINSITIELRKKAKEFNGDYDGWETFVVK